MKKAIFNICVHQFHGRRVLLTLFAIYLCKIIFMLREGFFFPSHTRYISISFCFPWGNIRNKQIRKWKWNGSDASVLLLFFYMWWEPHTSGRSYCCLKTYAAKVHFVLITCKGKWNPWYLPKATFSSGLMTSHRQVIIIPWASSLLTHASPYSVPMHYM